MLVHIDVHRLLELGLTSDQYVWLKLMYEGQEGTAQRFASMVAGAGAIEDYILSREPMTLDRKKVKELFDFKEDSYFWEFFSAYPLKVPGRNGGYRALKTQRTETKLAKAMKKKYESKVKTIEEHSYVMRCLEADLDHRRRTNSLQFLPAIETYINGHLWEKAEHLLDSSSTNSSTHTKYGEDLI